MMKPYTQLLSTLLIVLLVAGCTPQQDRPSSLQTINGTYTYTETGGVQSSITITGSNWCGSLKICAHCDTERQSGVVRDNKLYDSSGSVQVGSISNGTVRMRMGTGTATHRK